MLRSNKIVVSDCRRSVRDFASYTFLEDVAANSNDSKIFDDYFVVDLTPFGAGIRFGSDSDSIIEIGE